MTAALLSLALHGLLFAPVLLGGSGHRARIGRTEPALTWVAVAASKAVAQEQLSVPLHFRASRVDVPDPAPIDLDSSLGTQETVAPDPVVAYVWKMGALTARIQSVWKLPRARLAADFHCRVRIRPGDAGAVDEVEFESCDEVEPLRTSLLQAIERAAPLPKLSDAPEGSGAITLHFAAYAAPTDGRHTVVEPGAQQHFP